MGSARAQIEVPGPISEAERLWYDTSRWPSFVDGLAHVVKREGDWPDTGARVMWDSGPQGRGRVLETVVAYEVRSGQTVEVEDPRIAGTQSISFTPAENERCRIALELDYRLKQGGPFGGIVDALFVRRAFRDALRRTLSRFARELRSDRELGV
ncbi:MAG TPA: SRPBCC family protein [Solirubrobacteraceae bacterium]|nr:SRPBCC family protein [Solirubrobacteraceae bacterium]